MNRNANNAKHDTVDVPASNMKKSIAQILLDEGYIKNFQLIDDGVSQVRSLLRPVDRLAPGWGRRIFISGRPCNANHRPNRGYADPYPQREQR